MRKPDENSLRMEFQSQYGLEPEVVANLVKSQKTLARMGQHLSLVEVYVLEYGDLPDSEEEEEEEEYPNTPSKQPGTTSDTEVDWVKMIMEVGDKALEETKREVPKKKKGKP